MKIKIWKRPRNLKTGIMLCPYAGQTNFAGEDKIEGHFEVPIQWENQCASMSFYGMGANVRFNSIATRLLNHPHLVIRGPAYIVTNIEERYKMRAWGTYQEVTNAITHVGLSALPIIIDIGVRVPQQDIYAATDNDLFAIRMAL